MAWMKQSAKAAEIPEENPAKKPKRKKSKAWILLVVVLLATALAAPRFLRDRTQENSADSLYKTATVSRRDITSAISDSGSLQPADSYTVISLVSGEILSAGFNTGDQVNKNDVLYEVDSSDVDTGIQRAELALSQSRRSYNNKLESVEKLHISAPIGGKITGISHGADDMVSSNAVIARIENTTSLTLTEYYSEEYRAQIHVGMDAVVSVSDHMLTLDGTVREIAERQRFSETGIPCFAVTIQVANPGALNVGAAATGWLNGTDGALYPSIADDDGLDALEAAIVRAGISGTVESVSVRNEEIISAGQTIMRLHSDTLSDEIDAAADALRDAELSLKNQKDNLENYTICAPISGTIVDKYYKEGENAENGKTLCTIFDLSSLTITLHVDELDIRSIAVGQSATVTADAVPETTYQGVITEISINGTAAGGVTTYPVTVRIDETEGLLPGMNADVSIVVSENKQVLTLPAEAVETAGRVLVKNADGSTGENAPAGYRYVKVEIGVSDDNYVEILSGLAEGDEVSYIPDTGGGLFEFMMNGGAMGGGPPGGMNAMRGGA